MNFLKTENTIKFLLIIFPLSLVVGPLIAEIVMNLISIMFLFKVYEKRDFKIFNKSIFYYLLLFFVIINLSSILSIYREIIILKSLASFRYIIFIFSVFYFLQIYTNLNQIFLKWLSLTLLVIIIDGYIQYFFGVNSFGFESYRHDRISGFFENQLILGSYLLKFLILFLSLIFFNYKIIKKNELIFYLILILFGFYLIIATGDRAPFYLLIVYVILLFISISFRFKNLIIMLLVLFSVINISFNKTFFDRYIAQTLKQVQFKSLYINLRSLDFKNFYNSLRYYGPIYNTAHKAFLDKKFFGHGPKTYRYFCSEAKFQTFFKDTNENEKNIITFNVHRDTGKVKIKDLFFSVGDFVNKGDLILTYEYEEYFGLKKEIRKYYSAKQGRIKSSDLSRGSEISKGRHLFHLDPETTKSDNQKKFKDGCTTHPHNHLLQLLSETGVFSALIILYGFVYFIFKYLKYMYEKFFKKRIIYSNAQMSLIIYFIISLFPLITTGNFFNNWLNMISIFPIGFYMLFKQKNDTNK